VKFIRVQIRRPSLPRSTEGLSAPTNEGGKVRPKKGGEGPKIPARVSCGDVKKTKMKEGGSGARAGASRHEIIGGTDRGKQNAFGPNQSGGEKGTLVSRGKGFVPMGKIVGGRTKSQIGHSVASVRCANCAGRQDSSFLAKAKPSIGGRGASKG